MDHLKNSHHCKGYLLGTRLNPEDIAELASNAGFKGYDLFIAIAVCGAESAFYTEARCENYIGDTLASVDAGIMQINVPSIMVINTLKLYDPVINMKAAYALWLRRQWEPWVSYTSKIVFHDQYRSLAALGVANYYMKKSKQNDQKVRQPFISIPELRKLYPDLPLG